jgi:hypothetical protein
MCGRHVRASAWRGCGTGIIVCKSPLLRDTEGERVDETKVIVTVPLGPARSVMVAGERAGQGAVTCVMIQLHKIRYLFCEFRVTCV